MGFELRRDVRIREQLIVSKSGPEPQIPSSGAAICAAISTFATGTWLAPVTDVSGLKHIALF
jgi:hypothetical protein